MLNLTGPSPPDFVTFSWTKYLIIINKLLTQVTLGITADKSSSLIWPTEQMIRNSIQDQITVQKYNSEGFNWTFKPLTVEQNKEYRCLQSISWAQRVKVKFLAMIIV